MLLLVLELVLEMLEKFKFIHSSYALTGQELLTVRRSSTPPPYPTPSHPSAPPPPAFKLLLQSEEDVNQSLHTKHLPVDSPGDSVQWDCQPPRNEACFAYVAPSVLENMEENFPLN